MMQAKDLLGVAKHGSFEIHSGHKGDDRSVHINALHVTYHMCFPTVNCPLHSNWTKVFLDGDKSFWMGTKVFGKGDKSFWKGTKVFQRSKEA